METTPIQQDLLADSEIILVEATTGQRFLNWLIDNLLMQFALSYASGILWGIFLGVFFPEFLDGLVEGSGSYYLLTFLIAYTNYLFYYTLCEKAMQGRTLGKLITGTKAVRLNGDPLTLKDAFMRSLVRIVPFEAFSGFGTPWHDSWTDTTVIKTR